MFDAKAKRQLEAIQEVTLTELAKIIGAQKDHVYPPHFPRPWPSKTNKET